MAFHHIKLLNASFADPKLPHNCEPFCDEIKNPFGTCPLACMNFCGPICIKALPDFPLPTPPSYLADETHDPPVKQHGGLSLFLTVSLAVLSAAFFVLICYTVYRFCINRYNFRRRRRQLGEEEVGGGDDEFSDGDPGPESDHHIWYIRTIGLQPSVISAITVVKYKKGDGLIDGTDCSVCLNEFQEDETLRLLPKCNHAFHIPCIDTWLRSHTNCPLCRAGIVKNVAVLPSQDLIVQNSGPVGGSTSGEVARDVENEGSELRIGIDENSISHSQVGLDVIQPMRRSVSVNSLPASMKVLDEESAEVKESNSESIPKSDGINQRLLRLIGSVSIERPSCINRSLSCNAKV